MRPTWLPRPRWPRWRVETRLALGLTMLFVGILLMLDLALGLTTDPQRARLQAQRAFAQHLAISVAQLYQLRPSVPPVAAVRELALQAPDVRSVGLAFADGRHLALLGSEEALWPVNGQDATTAPRLRVPILQGNKPFGTLQVLFAEPPQASTLDLLRQPFVQATLWLGLLGWASATLYLRRVLHAISPQQAIPQRVRAAFDVLDEGVLLLDPQHRVMMCNDAFMRLLPPNTPVKLGEAVTQFSTLLDALARSGSEPPWVSAQRDLQPTHKVALRMAVTNGMPTTTTSIATATDHTLPLARHVIAHAAPVLDAQGRARGTMLSLADVTDLQRLNTELADSRDELRQRNQELLRLATRDPMTGCLNRRSFFELAGGPLDQSRAGDQPLGCVMTDIDHFKRINDEHGHPTGDAVIVAVANTLSQGLRESDLLCRYGGEEFCLLLPGLTLDECRLVAERLRQSIELHVAAAASQTSGSTLQRVTASFGVAAFDPSLAGLPHLIARADAALYEGKRGGRNRVQCWQAATERGEATEITDTTDANSTNPSDTTAEATEAD